MPVRTAYAGAAVPGEVLTAANVNKIPGGWIGYAQVVANQASITANVDITGLTVTVTVGTDRRIRVSGFVQTDAGAGLGSIIIQEGAAILVPSQHQHAAGDYRAHAPSVVLTPTAGAHTYKLTAQSNPGTMTVRASATQPAHILVEDLGPAT